MKAGKHMQYIANNRSLTVYVCKQQQLPSGNLSNENAWTSNYNRENIGMVQKGRRQGRWMDRWMDGCCHGDKLRILLINSLNDNK